MGGVFYILGMIIIFSKGHIYSTHKQRPKSKFDPINFDTDFDHTHENPSKIPLSHTSKNHQNYTKTHQTQQNQALYRIITKSSKISTTIYPNINTTILFKTTQNIINPTFHAKQKFSTTLSSKPKPQITKRSTS